MTEEIFQTAMELRQRINALEMLKNQILAMTHGTIITHKIETEIFGNKVLAPIRQDFRPIAGLHQKQDIDFLIDCIDNRLHVVKSELEKL